MFGVRSEADAELTKKTLPALRELYRRERSRVCLLYTSHRKKARLKGSR